MKDKIKKEWNVEVRKYTIKRIIANWKLKYDVTESLREIYEFNKERWEKEAV